MHDLPYVFPNLIVDYFSPILWREHDVIFAHPFRVCQTVCLIGHTKHLSSLVCGLNTHIISERCFGLGVTPCPHPHSGWFFVSLVSRVRLPEGAIQSSRFLSSRFCKSFCTV